MEERELGGREVCPIGRVVVVVVFEVGMNNLSRKE